MHKVVVQSANEQEDGRAKFEGKNLSWDHLRNLPAQRNDNWRGEVCRAENPVKGLKGDTLLLQDDLEACSKIFSNPIICEGTRYLWIDQGQYRERSYDDLPL